MVNEEYTNEQGTYIITGVAPGTYTLNITKEGYVSAEETVTVTNKDETANIILTEEAEEETVETGAVQFTIQDSEEQGIAGARIVLTNTATNEEFQNGNGGTGSSGGSKISNLPYGTYSVSVTCEGYETATDEVVVESANSEKTITLTEE